MECNRLLGRRWAGQIPLGIAVGIQRSCRGLRYRDGTKVSRFQKHLCEDENVQQEGKLLYRIGAHPV